MSRWLSASCSLLLALSAPAWGARTEAPRVEPAVASGEKAPLDAALIIGNEGYSALPQATWAGMDALAFRDWALGGRGISKNRLTYAENIDRRAMLKLAEKMGKRVGRRGTAWIYFSGHGSSDGGGQKLLLGVEAEAGEPERGGVSVDELSAAILKNKNVGRVVFILDAGFGNVGRDGTELSPGRETKVKDGFPAEDSRVVVWAAQRAGGRASGFEPARHGLFTWSVLGALRGWADGELDGNPDGKVTFSEAQLWVARAPGRVGRPANPTVDLRPEVSEWAIVVSKNLESAPPEAVFQALAREDLDGRIATAEAQLRADAEAFWADTQARIKGGGPEAEKALQAYINEFSGARLNLQWSIDLPRVQEARRILAGHGTVAEVAPVGPAPEAASKANCDDLIALEGPAMLGDLGEGLRVCLEQRLRGARLQTEKGKISRLLIIDAEAGKRQEDWQRLVQRHLEDVDRSDPDLCMRYAVFLHKAGLENEEEALRWSAYALENKQTWTGDEFVRKVSGLYRLRAEAANRLWTDAEQRLAREPSPENDSMTREYRGWAMSYAREWLDYARASGGKTDQARVLCESAAGTTDFCKEGAPIP